MWSILLHVSSSVRAGMTSNGRLARVFEIVPMVFTEKERGGGMGCSTARIFDLMFEGHFYRGERGGSRFCRGWEGRRGGRGVQTVLLSGMTFFYVVYGDWI